MLKSCIQCSGEFDVTEDDIGFYEKVSPVFNGEKFLVPSPTFCPDCRQQRRLAWRNERSLYYRNCSETGVKMLSMYKEDAKFPVYDNDFWWGDGWDAIDYGREFDFNRGFFEQLAELRDVVPHFALAVAKTTMQNSDYCNHAGYLKDCYLIFNTDNAEKCMYSKAVNFSYECLDCTNVTDSELCYEVMDSTNCKRCTYLFDSHNSSECHFSYNLNSCRNCFFSANLSNKEYCFLNEQYTKVEWEKKVADIRAKYSTVEILEKLMRFREEWFVKWMHEKNTESCTGDYLVNCKGCESCYNSEYLENCKWCYDLKRAESVSHSNYDVTAFGLGVVDSYECGTVGYDVNHVLFGENVWSSSDVYYSLLCVNNCRDCFGCVGLKKKQYCILNKQYSKEKYEELVPKIIEHMIGKGEWGEFFPSSMSPFEYIETVAQEYFPVEVVSQKVVDFSGDELVCLESGKAFRLQKTEADFYKKMSLPLPKFCPDVRHLHRLRLRNPRRLFKRKCFSCAKELETTFSSERKEKVYCGECYLKVVY